MPLPLLITYPWIYLYMQESFPISSYNLERSSYNTWRYWVSFSSTHRSPFPISKLLYLKRMTAFITSSNDYTSSFMYCTQCAVHGHSYCISLFCVCMKCYIYISCTPLYFLVLNQFCPGLCSNVLRRATISVRLRSTYSWKVWIHISLFSFIHVRIFRYYSRKWAQCSKCHSWCSSSFIWYEYVVTFELTNETNYYFYNNF